MHIAPHEAHQIAVYAGQGETSKMTALVQDLAKREDVSTAEVLIGSKDDFQQTAAHTAAKAGQSGTRLPLSCCQTTSANALTESVEALAGLLGTQENKTLYFNMASRFTGDRPVHSALREGHLDVLGVLVVHGADPTVMNRFGDTVMDYPGDFEPEEVQKVVDGFKSKLDKEGK